MTQSELEEIRQRAAADLEQLGYPLPILFTCDECSDKLDCPFSMDSYNTNGDCLASK